MLSIHYSKLVKKSGGREIRVGKLRQCQDEVSLQRRGEARHRVTSPGPQEGQPP